MGEYRDAQYKLKQQKKKEAKLKSLKRKFASERKTLVKQFESHNRDISFANQLAELFLNPSEISKVWERSERDPKTGLWKLPRITPKKEWEFVRLPDKPGMPAKMGIKIGLEEEGLDDEVPVPRVRKQQTASSPLISSPGGKNVGGGGSNDNEERDRARKLKKLSKN